ncbi:protein SUPPRESSOR OF PHYA-105 1-like [Magnolia sinica]|uniref:protein SUPPRESSOR OF PHYA-105 1-like n=1 Tax=Magnolia sinica TaxID=86752 RepID=UPI00265B4DB7|nr:protein SUPPRESSOR OF PHYA-105 1-like [Magnolia sinica]XP_058096066.1 protein SUPPRESSOR OF PHYA-105 1-like [Magnolia sinica]
MHPEAMEGTGDLNGVEENAAEAPHLKRKDYDHPQSESRNMMESPGTFMSPANDWHEPHSSSRSPEVFTETLEGKILVGCAGSKNGSEQLQTNPHTVDDAGLTVEELTLKNYKGSNLSIVGCSNSRDKMPRKGQWQHLYQLASGTGNRSSRGDVVSKEQVGGGEDVVPKSQVQKPPLAKHPNDEDHVEISEHLINSDNHTVSSNSFTGFQGGIRTKVLSASGFSQFFVKKTLKGKGVVYRCPGTHEGSGVVIRGQNNEKVVTGVASDISQGSTAKADDLSRCSGDVAGARANLIHDGVSLREWLKARSGKINKDKSLHMFRQILEVVDLAHSQGVALQHMRPSCFMMLPLDKVKYVGSWGPQIQTELLDNAINQDAHYSEHHLKRKRYIEQGMNSHTMLSVTHQKLSDHTNFVGQLPKTFTRSGLICETFKEDHNNNFRSQNSGCDFREQNSDKGHKPQNMSSSPRVLNSSQPQLGSESIHLEERWYASPEELNGGACTLSSNIYSLGVLLFELLCYFELWEVHAAAMSDLRHRILPPNFLSKNPNEAGFCLWLLHPEPSSRPKTREILQSDLICKAQNLSSRDQSSLSVDEEDAESELLLHFLITLREQKQKQIAKLVENIGCLKADIGEVEKRHSLRNELLSGTYKGSVAKDTLTSFHNNPDECIHNGPLHTTIVSGSSMSQMNEARLLRNMNQLENAYFSMRAKLELPETDGATRLDKDVLKNQDRWSPIQNDNEEFCMNKKPTDHLGSFFDGICKYARYSKFQVRGILRNSDLLNSANVICSLSFDRDEEYFAAAGVSKKIKIFEIGSLLNNTVDIHYPVIEMSSKSKLSCVCWNSYIKNYLASTDYDGVVQLWDASTGRGFSRYTEHQKRAWSVDFSRVDPTKLASGSDDCSVKLWSINEENCISTVRNVANVCCVQFSSYSTHLLAFGSADYNIYCYDLRTTRVPWCTLAGHGKAVSYVKFLDPGTLVSASTDNTLKLWDLNKTTPSGDSTSACSLTLSGHTNEKNFVGLSVSDGYIACGSETNEVYAYYKSLPMPITSHKFGSIDPITRQETDDDNGQFVSSVCWREKANMVVAANSNGSIKLLQMV